MKYIRYLVEFLCFGAIYAGARFLPLRWNQGFLGGLAKLIGPLLPVHSIGLKNITQAFPAMNPQQKQQTLKAMWWHLGALCAEYGKTYSFGRFLSQMVPTDFIEATPLKQLRADYDQAIFVSAHLGNWALATAYIHQGYPDLIMVHRAPNNPLINKMFHYIQRPFSQINVEKNRSAGLRILKLLKNKKSLVMLMDQKNNAGVGLQFFGHTAMTSISAAQLSHLTQAPIIPFCALRTERGSWQIVIETPITPPQNPSEYAQVSQSLNTIFEGWIRKNPEQWFWVHKRYDKSFYQ